MQKIPKRFWNDMKYAHKNYSMLVKKFKHKWVSVFNKKVIFADKDLEKVETETKKILGKRMFPVIYVECGNHIY